MFKTVLFTLLFCIVGFAIPRVALAQTLPAGYTDTVTVAPAASGYYVVTLGGLITAGIKWVAYISGIFLLIYLVWGGTEWIASGGDKAKVEAGRTRITQSIIGFAILACIFVGYAVVLDFLGLRCKVGIGNIGAGTCAGGTTTGGGPTTGTNSTCTTATVGQTFNDGGAGGYCSGGGAAQVRCMPAGAGGLNYPHFEPCSCISGTLNPGVDIRGCQ